MHSPADLEREVAGRRKVEEQLRVLHADLERRVAKRMAELLQVNSALRNKIEERKRIEAEQREQAEQLRMTFAAQKSTDLDWRGPEAVSCERYRAVTKCWGRGRSGTRECPRL
jgi:hypothetical protein